MRVGMEVEFEVEPLIEPGECGLNVSSIVREVALVIIDRENYGGLGDAECVGS